MNAQQTIERLNQILAEASKLTTQLLKMKISVAASNEAMDYNQLALAFPNLKTKNSYLQNAIKYLNEKGMWEWDEKRTSSIEKYKEIARACSISLSYLRAICVKDTKFTLEKMLLNIVVEKAKQELINSTKTVSEIAYERGFKDEYHFSKVFKRITGSAPKQYRNCLV